MRKTIMGRSIRVCCVVVIILGGCQLFSPPPPPPLEWENLPEEVPFTHVMQSPNDPEMNALRMKYSLEELVAGAKNDYETLQRLATWTHEQWSHSGSHEPSRPDPLTILKEASEGERFRCVEYAIVVAACARALGMPSRVLSLRRHDMETARVGAGHVVAEIWLNAFQKWVMVDAQFDAIPEMHGVPLNAVEFQQALAQYGAGLRIRSSSALRPRSYVEWISPYLYYFQVARDQRFFQESSEDARETILLVPKGAKKPTVFQRDSPIENCTYVSHPLMFYPVIREPL